MTFVSYAQNFEDVILWRALKNVASGFYIDVGANDPTIDSVTKAFYDRGWHGINVEPLASHNIQLQAQRRRDVNIQCAAGSETGEIELWDCDVRGWATVSQDVVSQHIADGHQGTFLTVPVRRLTDICTEFAPGEIHFLKIDVEGHEAAVVSGMDFSKFRPWILVVEATKPNSTEEVYNQWENSIFDARYSLAYSDGLNRFYVADEHSELIDVLHYPPNVFDDFVRSEQLNSQIQAQQAEHRAEVAERRAEQAEVNAQQATERATLSEARQTEQKVLAQAMEARLQQMKEHIEAVESKRLPMVLKNKVVRPLLITANRLLQPHRQFKQNISLWLFRRFPQTHHRLRRLLQQQALSGTATRRPTSESGSATARRSMPSALLDPALSSLERPVGFDAGSNPYEPRDNETLEPMVDLSPMRQSGASVCFVVPVRQLDRPALERTVQSVLRQTDPAWELLLTAAGDMEILAEEWLDIDWRIRRLSSPAEADEIRQLLEATVQASTNFVGLLSQGDLADDDLVKRIGQKSREAPLADIIYTDEIRLLDNGERRLPFFKPDWSPEHQHSVNMLGRFVAIRKPLLLNLHLSGSGAPEAVEYELNLAVAQRARQVAHIDDLLYIRRDASQAPVGGFFSTAALADARDVLERQLVQEDPAVQVIAHPESGSLHVRWPLPENVPVTLLILTGMHERNIPGRGQVVLATNFVRSIVEKSSFKRYKIIVVDDGFVPDDLRVLLQAHGHTTHTYPKKVPFSFAHKANFASGLVKSGIAILLNDDLEVISTDWIDALATQAYRPAIGAVGARLLFADGLLQHAGIAMGFHGSAGHMFHHTLPDGKEYAGFASIERNYSAVTGAVLAYRKDVFDEVGGFDEQFQTDYNDLDFCLKCVERGYRVVYTPAATLYHFHNSSFKRMQDKDSEREAFLKRWKHVVARDPHFSKHFQTQSHDLPLLIE